MMMVVVVFSAFDRDDQGWDSAVALQHLNTAAKLEPSALSCIIKGLMVLHGSLEECSQNSVRFHPHIAVRKVPTYYGMMTASFMRN